MVCRRIFTFRLENEYTQQDFEVEIPNFLCLRAEGMLEGGDHLIEVAKYLKNSTSLSLREIRAVVYILVGRPDEHGSLLVK